MQGLLALKAEEKERNVIAEVVHEAGLETQHTKGQEAVVIPYCGIRALRKAARNVLYNYRRMARRPAGTTTKRLKRPSKIVPGSGVWTGAVVIVNVAALSSSFGVAVRVYCQP